MRLESFPLATDRNGVVLDFDAFVTNVFENHDGRWLMVSHQATPMFGGAK